MASKTPNNAKASPMEHAHVRLPNLRNQIRAAAEAGETAVDLTTASETDTVALTTDTTKGGK